MSLNNFRECLSCLYRCFPLSTVILFNTSCFKIFQTTACVVEKTCADFKNQNKQELESGDRKLKKYGFKKQSKI